MVIGKFGQRGDYRCQINLDTQTLIKKKKQLSEEQKIAAGERMRKYQASKHN